MDKKKQSYLGIFILIIIISIVVIAIEVSPTGMFKRSTECSDHIDNDGDGYCDFAWRKAYCSDGSTLGDSGCSGKNDNSEDGCGDGTCGSGENCNTCAADCLGSGQVCCNGVAYTGNCCYDTDCTSPETCVNHVCTYQDITHTECSNGYCVIVNSAGTDECTVNADCQHKECVGEVCSTINSPGSDTCVSNADCIVETHMICSYGSCIEINGTGTDECSTSSDCQHKECVGQVCETIMTSGTDQCTYNSDCDTGTSYYVSTSGSDSNPGTLTQPWRTIQHSMDVVNPGDTVYVRGGTYYERLTLKRCGTSNAWITFKNYPGETPIIDGSYVTDYGWGGALVQIGENAFSDWSPLPSRGFWGVEYIKFSGFTVQNTNIYPDSGRGVGIGTYFSRYIIIENCITKETGAPGIANYNGMEYLTGTWDPQPHPHHIWILNNTVINANSGSPKVGEALSSSGCDYLYVIGNKIISNYEGISAGFGSTNVTIANNDVASGGPDIYCDAGGHIDDTYYIYENYLHGENGLALGFETYNNNPNGGTNKNFYIYNNIFAQTTYHGFLAIWDPATTTAYKQNIQIINNVFDVPGRAIDFNAPYSTFIWEDVIVRNNIIYGGWGGIKISGTQPTSELTVDHNMFAWGGSSDYYGSDYLIGDPQVVNRAGDNYHLQSTSPCIDAGSSVGAPTIDYDENTRPQGSGFDMGAFEYVGS
jgi:hypothetical protein